LLCCPFAFSPAADQQAKAQRLPASSKPKSGTPAQPDRSNDLRVIEAVKAGNSQLLRSLISQHADVNAAEVDGATALSWAVYRDDLEEFELLLGARANLNAANDYGLTPLSLACANGNAVVVQKASDRGR